METLEQKPQETPQEAQAPAPAEVLQAPQKAKKAKKTLSRAEEYQRIKEQMARKQQYVIKWENHIAIDYERRVITGITEDDWLKWMSKYPSIDVVECLADALAWALEHQERHISRPTSFLNRWLFHSEFGFK